MTEVTREPDRCRPNVVVFLTDQQRWDTMGLHGNPLDLTPNLDRLAGQGTFPRYSFTNQPVCAPSRASLQTGQYATQTGVYRNDIPLSAEATTLAHLFRDAGYRTGYIGKWHLSEHEPVPREDRGGYEFWLGANQTEFVSDAYRTVLFDGDGQEMHLPGYRVDATTDAAIRFIDDHDAEPFFLFVSYLEPHHQNHTDDYPPPTGYRERYQGRWMPPDLAALGGSAHRQLGGYFGMVKRLDEALGRLVDALVSLGLLDDTIVLFTSDHGCHFKTRNSEYKRSAHDASVRVPTVLHGGRFSGGRVLEELVSHVDLAPTLLDAAGLEVPESMSGRSFLPLVERHDIEWPDDIYVQISEAQVGRAVRTARWKYAVYAPDADAWDDPTADHFVEEALYDLAADPYELDNLIFLESHRGVADAMRARLVAHMERVEGISPRIDAPAEPFARYRERSVPPGEELT